MATATQIYDVNRDLYIEREKYERERYEREMQLNRMKMEDEFHRQQQSMYGQAIFGQASQGQMVQVKKQATPDPKDPLAFLNKSDNKLLLTGETS